MMKYIVDILSAVVIAVVIGGVGFLGITTYKNLRQQEIANEAKAACAMAYRYTKIVDKEVTVSYPMTEEYQKCLSDRNIK